MIHIRKRFVLVATAAAVAVGSVGVFAQPAAAQSVCFNAKVVVNGNTLVDQQGCLPPA